MATLVELSKGKPTDKNTTHSYLSYYHDILTPIRESAKNVMEVGIFDGGSIALWAEFFTNATVHAQDIVIRPGASALLAKYGDRVKTYTTDAYSQQQVENLHASVGEFDFIIDDGPHTLQSMVFMAREYPKLLSPKGILIIEDVQRLTWVPIIKAAFPAELQDCVTVYDVIANKNRYDDVFIVLDKSKKQGGPPRAP